MDTTSRTKTVADEPTPTLDLGALQPVAVTDGGSDSGTLAGVGDGRSPCKVCGAASADGIHIDHDDDCWAGGEHERKKAGKWETLRRETIEQNARYRRDREDAEADQ